MFAAAVVVIAAAAAVARARLAPAVIGVNPHPVRLARPPVVPLSPVARLGRKIFFDTTLSGSGRMSCATCHDPAYAYGPPDAGAVRLGGAALDAQGMRAVPSLRYMDRVPGFSIGPDNAEAENASLARRAAVGAAAPRSRKSAGVTAPMTALVPRGGFFWDGRASTLQAQALIPLFSPVEMANGDMVIVAAKLRRASYGKDFALFFGAQTVADARRLVDEATFAVGRFELEDSSFHPYSSKYDAYLQGTATLTPAEARGLAVFEDPARGNCAACHLDRPGQNGRPPMFTDYQYEALGVPRNEHIIANRNPRHFDLGLCGPARADLATDSAYCGMFRTPSLRNVATRRVFFHNGVFHTLRHVLEFYAFRDTRPDSVYPHGVHGHVEKFNDMPSALRGNVDTIDGPFDRHAGDAPALTARDIDDLIAFLKTLTDGWDGRR